MRTVAQRYASRVSLSARAHCLRQVYRLTSTPVKEQLCVRPGDKVVTRAAPAYEVAFTSEQPYYVLPEKKAMLQKITVVKVSSLPE